MTTTTDPSFDLVCVPGAIAPGERVAHFVLGYRLFAKLAKERIDLPSGIALRLDADNVSEVARFVANERKCCPFLHIEVDIAPGGGPMWLRLTGPEGTRELIEAELGLARWFLRMKLVLWSITALALAGLGSECAESYLIG